jgi:hypothetical protein
MKRASTNHRVEPTDRKLPLLERAHQDPRVREPLEIALGQSGQVRTQFDGDHLDAKLGERDAQLPGATADLQHTRPASKCRRRDNGVDHFSGGAGRNTA